MFKLKINVVTKNGNDINNMKYVNVIIKTMDKKNMLTNKFNKEYTFVIIHSGEIIDLKCLMVLKSNVKSNNDKLLKIILNMLYIISTKISDYTPDMITFFCPNINDFFRKNINMIFSWKKLKLDLVESMISSNNLNVEIEDLKSLLEIIKKNRHITFRIIDPETKPEYRLRYKKTIDIYNKLEERFYMKNDKNNLNLLELDNKTLIDEK